MERHSICLLNDSFPPLIDGVANTVTNYARQIEQKYGHAVVVTPSYPGADDSGYEFPVLRYPSIDMRKHLGYMAGCPFSPELVKRLKTEQIELLHSHCPFASNLTARVLRDVLDAPVVCTYHTKFDIDIAKAIRGKLLQEGAIHGLVQNINACDEVWVVSNGAGENLRSLGFEGEYTVMGNGVDMPRGRLSEEEIASVTSAYALPAGVPVYLFVGRMMWYKGLRIILDALAMLKAQGQDFRMVFIGDGADAAEVRETAQSLGLEERCVFTGAVSERETIRAWYGRADLFLFPSTFDTNGLVVREAAASGLASVMIRGSSAAENVTDGRNGFLIEENAASMAACLTELCRNPEQRQRVGAKAEEELYVSWDAAIAQAYERYQVVIDRYRSGAYPRHRSPADGFLRSQGELMDVLARLSEPRQELKQKLRETWQRMERYL